MAFYEIIVQHMWLSANYRFFYQKSFLFMQNYIYLIYLIQMCDSSLTCVKIFFIYHILELLHCWCTQIAVLFVFHFLFNLNEINFVFVTGSLAKLLSEDLNRQKISSLYVLEILFPQKLYGIL